MLAVARSGHQLCSRGEFFLARCDGARSGGTGQEPEHDTANRLRIKSPAMFRDPSRERGPMPSWF